MNYPAGIAPWREVMFRLQAEINEALDFGGNTHTIDDVIAKIETSRFKLFYTKRAVLILDIVDYPQRRVAFFWLAAGNLNELCQLEPFACDWARKQGITRVMATGRKGWKRISRMWHYGWRERPQVWLVKDL